MTFFFGKHATNEILVKFVSLQEERRQRLREHARRLIAETRAKSLDSPTSPITFISQRITLSPERTISPISNTDGFNFTQSSTGTGTATLHSNRSNSKESSPSKQIATKSTSPKDPDTGVSRQSPERNGNSPSLQGFNSVIENLTLSPQREKKVIAKQSHSFDVDKHSSSVQLEQMSYIESELEALEREQEAIDLKAGALEKKLRSVMGGTSTSKYK